MFATITAAMLVFAGLTAASLILSRAGGGSDRQRHLSGEYWVNLVYWLAAPTLVTWAVGRLVTLILAAAALVFYAGRPEAWCGFGPVAQLPPLARAATALICADFANYWVHRAMHASPILWPIHAVHHSSIELAWHSALRIHPLDRLAMRMGVLSVLLPLGFPLGALGGAAIVAGLIGILVHCDSDIDLGLLRYVIATPRFHRWHHENAPAARGKNLSGILPLWDILFGTFYMPVGQRPERFGPARPLPSTFRSHLLDPILTAWRKF